MIPQNDGDTVPIILSYSLYFSPADKGVNACHFALHHTRANAHFLMQFLPFLNKKKWQNPPPLIRKNMHLRSWHAPDMVACQFVLFCFVLVVRDSHSGAHPRTIGYVRFLWSACATSQPLVYCTCHFETCTVPLNEVSEAVDRYAYRPVGKHCQ